MENNIKKTLNFFEKLNEKYNFVKYVKEGIYFNDEPNYFNYIGLVEDFRKYSDETNYEREFSSGMSKDKEIAKIIAYAEAFERFCMSIYKISNFKKEPFSKSPKEKIHPKEFISISKQKDLDLENIDFYWDKCINLENNKEIEIPAQFIYVPFSQKETFLRHPISTGCAVGTDLNETIYSGICESIERDHFITTYLNKVTPYKIKNNSIKNKEIEETIEYFSTKLLEINLFKLNKDKKVHTVLCVLKDKSKNSLPNISLGCSTSVDIYESILKSINESLKSRIWVRNDIILNYDNFLKFSNLELINNIEERSYFWSHKKNENYLSFLLKNNKYYEFKEENVFKSDKLKIVLNYLKKKNLNIYIKDLKPTFIKEKDIYIIKAVIPELNPLYLYESFKIDTGKNLSKKLNEIPHPFL